MTDPDLRNLTQWLAAFRRGETSAADRLFAHYQPWLRFLARAQIETHFQAKFDPSDVVQQTLLEAARDLPQFRGSTGAELAAWLRQILAHVLAHEIRRYRGTQKRNLDREISLDQQLTQTSDRLGNLLPSDATPPADALIRHEQQLLLAAALERLPDDYRQIIVLRNLEGLAHDEIAQRLGRNPGAVRMLWVRALARLRQEVASLGTCGHG